MWDFGKQEMDFKITFCSCDSHSNHKNGKFKKFTNQRSSILELKINQKVNNDLCCFERDKK